MDNVRETTHQTAIIEYYAPCAFDLDEVFYRIERASDLYFRDACRVCGGTKSITVNGVTFKCPCCEQESVSITVKNYAVRRYRICGVSEEKDDYEWKPSSTTYKKIKAYRKVGHGHDTGFMNCRGGKWEFSPSSIVLNEPYNAEWDDDTLKILAYTDYALACKVADALTEREIARLAKINAERGTNFEAVFKKDHDPRSN